jgi:hypothetical protein
MGDLEFLRNIFPFSFGIGDTRKLVLSILGYVALGVIAGIVFGLLGRLWAIGVFFRVAGAIVDLYALLGAALAIRNYVYTEKNRR